MPPPIPDQGNEVIRGWLARWWPRLRRTRSAAYKDGWQQEEVFEGEPRDMPAILPLNLTPPEYFAQRGLPAGAGIGPTRREPIFPPIRPTDPPTGGDDDDPLPGPDPEPDPGDGGSGSGSGSGPAPELCQIFYLATPCYSAGSGPPCSLPEDTPPVYVCFASVCAAGGSGSGSGVMDGDVFHYASTCFVISTAVGYVPNDGRPLDPGQQYLPANAIVVPTATLECTGGSGCGESGCLPRAFYAVATPCEACLPADDASIPIFCFEDWLEVIGLGGETACFYFRYNGTCWYVTSSSTGVEDPNSDPRYVQVTLGDVEQTSSCCECCDGCAWIPAPGSGDDTCIPQEACCCGSAGSITLSVAITTDQLSDQLVIPGGPQWCEGMLQTQTEISGAATWTVYPDGSTVLQTNTLVKTTRTYGFPSPVNGCERVLLDTFTTPITPPSVGCAMGPANLWPKAAAYPPFLSAIRCTCDSTWTYTCSGAECVTAPSVPGGWGPECTASFPTSPASNPATGWPAGVLYETTVNAVAQCDGGSLSVAHTEREAYINTTEDPLLFYWGDEVVTMGEIAWSMEQLESCEDGCTAVAASAPLGWFI